jgi:hypothetical protein
MGRFTSFLGSGKSVAATTAQVITFTGNDLPSAGVVAYHFVTAQSSGATDVADITRIRVKADNRLIYDVGLTHFRKWQERFSTVGYALPTALTRWTIPFNLFDIVDDDLADTCQFPRGTVPTVEITLGAGSAAGSIYAGWTQTDAQPVFYPTLIGQQMNIAASAVNATFPINSQGAVRGMMVDTTGLSRFKAELNGFQYHQLTGAQYLGTATGDMVLESQALEDGAGTSGGVTITTAAGLRIPMVVASQGSSRVELDTGSSWVGTANELTLWAVNNQN